MPSRLLRALAPLLLGAAAYAQPVKEEDLLKDLQKANLTLMSDVDERKRFLNSISMEKLRIQDRMLRGSYENAYSMYKRGNYSGAREVASRILAIDPSFEDAAMLHEITEQLATGGRLQLSERQLLEEKFKEALILYQEGRLVESHHMFEAVAKLSPMHLKARYWLRRVQGEIAEIHYRKGEDAYKEAKLQTVLDHWYAALLLDPGYPRLVPAIERVEEEKRKREANRLMQQAITLYSQGKLDDSMATLREILEINPGEGQAESLMAEIKMDKAEVFVNRGREHYQKREYDAAVAEWRKAAKAGYPVEKARALIARAKEMKVKEEEARRQREEELARKREEEEKKKAEEEAKKKKKKTVGPSEGAGAAEGGGGEYGFGGLQDVSKGAEGGKEGEKKAGEEKKDAVEGKEVVGASGTFMTETQKAQATEAARRQAVDHYQKGMVFLQNRQIEQAKFELKKAKELDPTNMEVDAALRRIDAMVSGQ